VTVAVKNSGAFQADEVVQVYVGAPGLLAERPAKALKAFQRLTLAPGETRIVRQTIAVESLMWRDPATHQWRLEPGCYRVFAGGSSDSLIETTVVL